MLLTRVHGAGMKSGVLETGVKIPLCNRANCHACFSTLPLTPHHFRRGRSPAEMKCNLGNLPFRWKAAYRDSTGSATGFS